jgi:PXPV repeat (3 copies)
VTFKRVLALAVFAFVALPWGTTEASWRIGIGIGCPVYCRPYPYRVVVAPAPVIVAPAPVVYVPAAPPPVYVRPAPVYVQPAPLPVQAAPLAVQPQQNGSGLPPQPVPYR